MSFRTRLTSFFVLIVIVPMVAIGLLGFRLISDSEQGKADARASGLATAAASVYESEIDMWHVVSGIGVLSDGARGTRTPDLLGAIQALSQLSYSPEEPRSVPGRRLATVVSNGEYAACQG